MDVIISKILNSKSALFHGEGLEIFELLYKSIKNDSSVELSFKGLENCSTQFLNATFGKLYVEFPDSIIKKYLSYSNYEQIPMFEEKLRDVIENAKHYEQYDDNFDMAVYA